MNTETRKQIADTILDQLGGNRFIAMTGAKGFTFDAEGALSMRIGRNSKSINYLKISLTPADLYTMEFKRIRGVKVTDVETFEGVYCDMLQELFTEATGLYTHM